LSLKVYKSIAFISLQDKKNDSFKNIFLAQDAKTGEKKAETP
jgi:hypothetical protein